MSIARATSRNSKLLALAAIMLLLMPILAACGGAASTATPGAGGQATATAGTQTGPTNTAGAQPTESGAPGQQTAEATNTGPAEATGTQLPIVTTLPPEATGSPAAEPTNAGPTPTQLGQALDMGNLSPDIPDPASPVTVTFASWVGGGATMQRLKKQFEQLHPNIKIKFQDVPQDNATEKVTTQIAGGNAPDAAYLDAGVTQDFAYRKAIISLEPYIAKSLAVKKDDYVEGWLGMSTLNDQMYALPFDGESTGMFYRTDLFEAAGIKEFPKTWEEFRAAAEKLTDPAKKQYGFALFANEAEYYFRNWLWQAGGDYTNPEGTQMIINNEAGKKAAEYYVGLKEFAPPDLLNSNSYDGRTGFATGKVAMYMAGAWFGGVLNSEFPKIKGKWASAPNPCDVQCANTIAGDSLMIFEQSKNKDAAWKWIEFLSAPQNMAAFNLGTKQEPGTLLPPRKSLLNDPNVYANFPPLKIFGDLMQYGKVGTTFIPDFYKANETLQEGLSKAIYGEGTVEDALQETADVGQEILDNRQQ